MIIRPATEKDIPQMLVNGRTFTEAAYPDIPYDEESFLRECAAMIADGLCIVAVDENDVHLGGVGARAGGAFVNESYRVAQERFWWVAPEHRSSGVGFRLLIALEQAARDAGCHRLMMLSLCNQDVDKADAIYRKCEYVKTEHAHAKVLLQWVSSTQ